MPRHSGIGQSVKALKIQCKAWIYSVQMLVLTCRAKCKTRVISDFIPRISLQPILESVTAGVSFRLAVWVFTRVSLFLPQSNGGILLYSAIY